MRVSSNIQTIIVKQENTQTDKMIYRQMNKNRKTGTYTHVQTKGKKSLNNPLPGKKSSSLINIFSIAFFNENMIVVK